MAEARGGGRDRRSDGQPTMTHRARRRREEAVRLLVADITSATKSEKLVALDNNNKDEGADAVQAESNEWLIASTVATALEKGLDHDLHAELVQEAKNNASRIGQVCHDHADVFLASVAAVASLATPSADLADGLKDAQEELTGSTAKPMYEAAQQHEEARLSHARARTLHVMVDACQGVAVQLERARKQAGLGRPRSALDAVDQARTALTVPIESLFVAKDEKLWKETLEGEQQRLDGTKQQKLSNLEQTPFGKRATIFLPKIENEVLMSARRGLNKWFVSQRSGGEGAKTGRAVLRQCAHSTSMGPGALGLGGSLPASFTWRAKMADNLIARVGQSSKVARAARQGYWFDRDSNKEAARLEAMSREGIERAAEAFAVAFGWYRCWEEDANLLVDPSEWAVSNDSLHSSKGSLGGSKHGLTASKHGLRNSRHSGKGRTLGFKASTSSRSQAYQEISSTLGTNAAAAVKKTNRASIWAELLTPSILSNHSATAKEEDEIFRTLPESVHPVRRANVAFSLLGKVNEFVLFYEQNRFGEMKIQGDLKNGESERKSALSSLTGDDISIGTDRLFFSKTLPLLCANVVGYSAVEAGLDVSLFADEKDMEEVKGVTSGVPASSSLSAGRFHDSSERYERTLLTELGNVIKSRSMRANLAELCRSSCLLVSFRSALKIVHPSSTARRADKELLSLDADMIDNAARISQDEQLRAAIAIVNDDQKIPMLLSEAPTAQGLLTVKKSQVPGIPEPEELGLPFGLSEMKMKPGKAELEYREQSRTTYTQDKLDDSFTFSHSVPVIVRSIHARAIAVAFFALSQQELGQKFQAKRSIGTAPWVLDCVESCISASVIGMKDNDNLVKEGSVDKAVQVMANLSALQNTLPRLFGTIVRGMFHVGLVSSDEVDLVFSYAEKSLKLSEKSCDAQVGSTYSIVYEICRTKIDSHINYALDGFQWVAKAIRETPNPYCEGLIGYLRSVFASLGPMDEGSKAGLHFSCCGHVSERMVKLLSGRPGDTAHMDTSGIPPIARIDAYGIYNLRKDCEEFEKFADSCDVPSLRDCFSELRMLTTVMLDKELPSLLLPENAAARRRKYPLLSMEKVANILEKYQGTGMFAGGKGTIDILFLDKKEVTQLLKISRRSQ